MPIDSQREVLNAIRCISVCPEGLKIVCGDQQGNLHIFADNNQQVVQAHELEVICLAFSPIIQNVSLLASGSRDKLIVVFDKTKFDRPITVLSHHTKTVTGIAFME